MREILGQKTYLSSMAFLPASSAHTLPQSLPGERGLSAQPASTHGQPGRASACALPGPDCAQPRGRRLMAALRCLGSTRLVERGASGCELHRMRPPASSSSCAQGCWWGTGQRDPEPWASTGPPCPCLATLGPLDGLDLKSAGSLPQVCTLHALTAAQPPAPPAARLSDKAALPPCSPDPVATH